MSLKEVSGMLIIYCFHNNVFVQCKSGFDVVIS